MPKKPRKRVIPEYDDKTAIDILLEPQVAVANTEVPPPPPPPEETVISGDQFKGLEEFVEVDSTKYSSDMFDIEAPQEGDQTREE